LPLFATVGHTGSSSQGPRERGGIFLNHNVRYASTIEARQKAMKECVALTTDRGVTLPAQQMVRTLLPQVIAAIEAIASYDNLIAEVESKLNARRVFVASLRPRTCSRRVSSRVWRGPHAV
jgi:hypothetical protein